MKDDRGFFALPPAAEGSAYYRYGTPGNGAGQFSHPQMLNFIFMLAFHWGGKDDRKIGIGNVSLKNGQAFPPHRSHRSGLDVDMRPMRLDGKELPVSMNSREYDRAGTSKLVEAIWQTGMVSFVGFNDIMIPRVKTLPGHHDHLHITLKP